MQPNGYLPHPIVFFFVTTPYFFYFQIPQNWKTHIQCIDCQSLCGIKSSAKNSLTRDSFHLRVFFSFYQKICNFRYVSECYTMVFTIDHVSRRERKKNTQSIHFTFPYPATCSKLFSHCCAYIKDVYVVRISFCCFVALLFRASHASRSKEHEHWIKEKRNWKKVSKHTDTDFSRTRWFFLLFFGWAQTTGVVAAYAKEIGN